MEGAPRAAEGYTPLETYRYERKFVVEELTLPQVIAVLRLHPKMFYAPYPPRQINNLYLDTADLESYFDNVHGSPRRRKVRVRWYGELCGEIHHPVLEIKVKDGLPGYKHSYPLRSFELNRYFSDRRFQRALDGCGLPAAVRGDLRAMNVVLLNRYCRRYYASRDGSFRVTLDTDLRFYKINGAAGNTLLHRQVNFRDIIVELKYELKQETQADRVAGFFPFRITRSSKYVQGMEKVYF